jgi:hypothetical protein
MECSSCYHYQFSQFLDEVLEYFQENNNEKAKDFEAWKAQKERNSNEKN